MRCSSLLATRLREPFGKLALKKNTSTLVFGRLPPAGMWGRPVRASGIDQTKKLLWAKSENVVHGVGDCVSKQVNSGYAMHAHHDPSHFWYLTANDGQIRIKKASLFPWGCREFPNWLLLLPKGRTFFLVLNFY